ncbi:unnamed protein product [Moneuplotes crassus]|uniref:START domain-containing protein n=1 Tax=Euplotes crassus TaxID=5936 RepID=A0AAD1ULC9_EUPCR|nr:unnamed protein product [Moneuplotes crassus]
MPTEKELDLDKLLAMSKTDTTACVEALITEVRRLKGVMAENEAHFRQEIQKRDQKVVDLTHKLEKYNKIFSSFSRVLTNNGFGSNHHHFHRKRTSLKFANKEEEEKEWSGDESDEFHSFEGDLDGYESDEEVKEEINKFGRDLSKYVDPKDEDNPLLHEKMKVFHDMLDLSKWTTVKSKDDIELFVYSGEEFKASGTMSSTIFDYTPDQIIHFLTIPGQIESCSSVMEKNEIIGSVSQDVKIVYMKIAKILMIASRDFVMYSRRFTSEDSRENVIFYSIEDEEYLKSNGVDKPPLTDGTIRADVLIGGWHFEVLGPNKTRATNFMVNDFKGSIPKMVLNMGASTQAQVMTNMKKAMKKLVEEGEL